ncbi:stage II sporulation protein M [Caldanaerovirga acetigignens]|uniref:Stage II sporulation protein M n=1 Tax=Caldanaerovirga acetigignens TaxID=447595 RepID=A0A1M7FPQ1_9FIRM|nr:stage II sporulation protein M [Caldanaerovirga acetigignens]SHM06013.1 stage II sporulation protein M [Caldanaerovirga acetigignens]
MKAVLDSFRERAVYGVLALLVFLVGCFLGWMTFWQNPAFILGNLNKLLGNLLEISAKMEKESKLSIARYIFQNNARALFVMIFGGIAFGIVPFFALIFNGFVVGVVLALNFYNGQSLYFFLAGMLPHGILELPAILTGAAFGLKTGAELLFSKGEIRLRILKKNLKESILAFGILIPILLIAAFIEAVVTPLLLSPFNK